MWFDTRAALAKIAGSPPAEHAPRVADVAEVAAPLPKLTPEATARKEARRAAGVTALDEWRARADDTTNPDNWA